MKIDCNFNTLFEFYTRYPVIQVESVTDESGVMMNSWVNSVPSLIFIKSHIDNIEPFVSHTGTIMKIHGSFFLNGNILPNKPVWLKMIDIESGSICLST